MGDERVIRLEGVLDEASVHGEYVYLRAGRQEVLIRSPPLIVAYREPHRWGLIVAGVFLLAATFVQLVFWLRDDVSIIPLVPLSPDQSFALLLIVGIVLIVLGIRGKVFITIESIPGTKIKAVASRGLATRFMDEVKRSYFVRVTSLDKK